MSLHGLPLGKSGFRAKPYIVGFGCDGCVSKRVENLALTVNGDGLRARSTRPWNLSPMEVMCMCHLVVMGLTPQA